MALSRGVVTVDSLPSRSTQTEGLEEGSFLVMIPCLLLIVWVDTSLCLPAVYVQSFVMSGFDHLQAFLLLFAVCASWVSEMFWDPPTQE